LQRGCGFGAVYCWAMDGAALSLIAFFYFVPPALLAGSREH
jgi:hypothetical protein